MEQSKKHFKKNQEESKCQNEKKYVYGKPSLKIIW